MRTEKLKEKNKQIKTYNDEIQKLATRVSQLSEYTENILKDNKFLEQKCIAL